MLLLVMIFLTETHTCTKSCVFVMGDACTQNMQSLLEDRCLTMFSCSRCIVYGFNMVYYVWIVPSTFSPIKVFYFLFVSLLHNKDDQSPWCYFFLSRCFLILITWSVVCLHILNYSNGAYAAGTEELWLMILSWADKLPYITS